MTLDNQDRFDRHPSVGVDAVAFDRYAGVRSADDTYIVFDQKVEDAWIQSDEWCSL